MTKKKIRIQNSNQKDSNDISTNLKHGITIEKVSVFVNIMMVIITCFAIFNSNKANKTSQAALTELINKDSSDEKSADFNKKSAMAENRAYIFVQNVTLTHIIGDNYQVDINVKNLGKTPAYNLQAAKMIHTYKNEEPDRDTLWLSQKYYLSSYSVLGPNQEQSLLQQQTFEIDAKDTLPSNYSTNLNIKFRMQYFDIYGEVHRTRMHAVYNTRYKIFVNCKNYNDFN